MKVSSPIVCLWPGGRPMDLTGHGRVRWMDGDLVPVEEGGTPPEGQGARPRRRIGRARRQPTEEEVVRGFAAIREHGICPHPYDDDREVARMMVRAWADGPEPPLDGSRGRIDAPEDVIVGVGETWASEGNVEPDPRLGINNPMCLVEDESSSDDPAVSILAYNDYASVVADIARLGCGRVRHVNQPDLAWSKIHKLCAGYVDGDTDLIPRPDLLHARLVAGRYGAFSRFTLFWHACLFRGILVNPILFTYGGGSDLDKSDASYPTGSGADDTIPRWKVKIGRPEHQKGITVPAEWGWDPFYWDIPELDPSPEETDFQRFALNVFVPDDATPYMQEAARRKALALAAFGKAVGEYLAEVDGILATHHGASLGDLIPYVEFGNEMDSVWGPRADAGQQIKDAAARELGRCCALVAGPIQEACPGVRFKMPDLVYTEIEDDGSGWDARIEWLERSVTLGIREEVDRWNACGLVEPDVLDLRGHAEWARWQDELAPWRASCETAGFSWPPMGSRRFAATDLAHCVGLHLFLSHTHKYAAVGRAGSPEAIVLAPNVAIPRYVERGEGIFYADEIELDGILRSFRHGVLRIRADGFNGLNWAVGAVHFPAMIPLGQVAGDIVYLGRDENGVGTNPMYQAGILARRLLYLRTLDPEYVSWYTFMAQIAEMSDGRKASWSTEYVASGIRNDTYNSSDTDPRPYAQDLRPGVDFEASKHAWRRPAWFTLRRVAWLLDRTDEVTEVHRGEESRLVILRLTASRDRPYHQPDRLGSPTYAHAYLVWMDEMSDCEESWVVFEMGLEAVVEPSSLVPQVDGVPTAPYQGDVPQDPNGYPDVETPSWLTWDPPFGTSPSECNSSGSRLFVRVRRAHPVTNPAPLFLLSSRREIHVDVRGVRPGPGL